MSTELKPLRIFLFRHGETEWSLAKRHTGRTDLPLTQHGEQKARRLGQRLQGLMFNRVFTSPRLRARRTCELVDLNTAPETEVNLAEWDYGDYEGRRTDEIHVERPGWDLFTDGCPNGESPEEASERVERVIRKLRSLEGNVALFSHGHIGRLIGGRWIGLAATQARRLALSTASVSILGHEQNEPALLLWNADAGALCDPHLPLGDLRPAKQRALERWENEGGEIPGG